MGGRWPVAGWSVAKRLFTDLHYYSYYCYYLSNVCLSFPRYHFSTTLRSVSPSSINAECIYLLPRLTGREIRRDVTSSCGLVLVDVTMVTPILRNPSIDPSTAQYTARSLGGVSRVIGSSMALSFVPHELSRSTSSSTYVIPNMMHAARPAAIWQ